MEYWEKQNVLGGLSDSLVQEVQLFIEHWGKHTVYIGIKTEGNIQAIGSSLNWSTAEGKELDKKCRDRK